MIARAINNDGHVDHGFEAYTPTTVKHQRLATQISALQLTNVGPTSVSPACGKRIAAKVKEARKRH
jgi:hypothetical protein